MTIAAVTIASNDIWVVGTDLQVDQTMGADEAMAVRERVVLRWRVFIFFVVSVSRTGYCNRVDMMPTHSPAPALPFNHHILIIVLWMPSTTAYS
jgi:hypothetical protein